MSIWHAWRERMSLVRRNQRDRELDEEIQHHLETEARRQEAAGHSPSDARRRALERFGDRDEIVLATRDARGDQPLEGTMQDVRYAVRALSRNPGFTAIALLTLALGTGATVTSFAVLDTVLLKPLPYREADRLVFMREVNADRAVNPPSHPNFLDWRERARSFDGVASAMFPYTATVRPAPAATEPERVTLMGVSRGFFRTLGVPLAIGREFTDDENRLGGARVAVVSHEYWQNSMGGRTELGSVAFGSTPVTVVGVLPAGFQFITSAGIYVPHEQMPGTCRTCRNYMVVGRLKDNVNIEAARSEMTALSQALVGEYGTDTNAADVEVLPLLEYLVGDYRTLLGVVFGAATLVLLIAMTNLLGAQLARGWAREREVLVRSALGASRGRLLRQLTLESAILVAIGTGAGLLVAHSLSRFIRLVGSGLLPRLADVSIDGRVAILAVAIMVVVTLAVGMYPALRLSRGAHMAVRGVRGSSVTVKMSAWRGLLGFEIALAVALSVGAALLVRTFRNIINSDTGFVSRGIVTAAITPSEADAARMNEALRDLAAIPGVDGAAYTTRLPLSWGANSGPVRRPSDPPGPEWPAMAGFRMVSPEYFQVLRQPVLRGRTFTEADHDNAADVAIITPGIAEKLWPGDDPIGKTIGSNYLWDEWLTVVGVVAEASSWSQPRGEQNEIFVPISQHMHALPGQGQVVAVVRSNVSATSLTSAVRTSLRSSMPNSPATVGTMEERISRSAADRRFAMIALSAFAMIALLLAAMGIYGVIWYIVTTRVQEIGVRMALGATPGNVLGGVLAGALGVAAAGVVVGALAAAAGGKFLQSTLYGVGRTDPVAYIVSAGVVLLAVLLGAWSPARRASRVDPMVAMRAE